MAVIRFACPGCQSVLKSSNPIALGTKIKCPRCSHIFPLTQEAREAALVEEAIATPARKEAASEGYAELDDAESDDDQEEEREVKPRPKLKKKGKKADRTALILALSLGGLLVVLGGAGAGLWYWLREPNFQEPLAFVPASSSVVMNLDVEGTMEQFKVTSDQIERALSQGRGKVKLGKCKELTGLEINELLNHVTFAIATPLQQLVNAQSGANVKPKMVTVIKSKTPFDKEKVRKLFELPEKPEKMAGKAYYKGTDEDGETWNLFMPSRRLIVATTLGGKELEALLTADGNKLAPSGDVMGMINSVRSSLFWLVAPNDAALNQSLQNGPGAGAMTIPGLDPKALQAAMTGAKVMGLWVGVENQKANVHFGFQFGDSAGAGKLAAELEKTWKLLKGFAGLAMFGMKDQPQFVKDGLKELMNNTKVSSQDNLAKVTIQLSVGLVKTAFQEMQKGGAGMLAGNPAIPTQPGAGPSFGPGNFPRPNNPVAPKPGGPSRGGKGAPVPGRPGN
jgi:hypothetical protein